MVATGFDVEKIDDARVKLEFFGDDGVTFVQVVVSMEAWRHLAAVGKHAETLWHQNESGGWGPAHIRVPDK